MAIGIIPARFSSTRFPGKSLALLAGQPVIRHVYRAASRAASLSAVWIATDDERIANAAESFGAKVLMTRPDHVCGSDRLVEALEHIGCGAADIVVNIQGDEPLLQTGVIDRCVRALEQNADADWTTLIYPLENGADADNPNVVKVVCDLRGFALYFSRLAIPFNRGGTGLPVRFGHAGLYAYRAEALRRFASCPPTPLEQSEKLEQLRALEHGMKILCVEVERAYPGVDTPEDLEHLEALVHHNQELLTRNHE